MELKNFNSTAVDALRALVVAELNSCITILIPPKHKNQPYSSEVKGIFF